MIDVFRRDGLACIGSQSWEQKESGVFFVHGLSNCKEVWLPLTSLFTDDMAWIAMDLPGCGQSDGIQNYQQKDFQQVMERLLQSLPWKNIIWAGHSFGGHLGLQYLRNNPQSKIRLLALAPAGLEHFTPYEKRLLRQHEEWFGYMVSPRVALGQSLNLGFESIGGVEKKMIQWMLDAADRQPLQEYTKMVNGSIQTMLADDTDEYLMDIHQPVFVLFGANDQWIPNPFLHPHLSLLDLKKQVLHQNPKIHFQIWPKGRHFIQIEQPHACLEAILQLLKMKN